MAETVKRPEEAVKQKIESNISQHEADLPKATASPSRHHRRSADHSVAPLTPGRSRMGSTPRGYETPEKGASVPKFGEWDENDPSSADGYTHIFTRVREEKQGGAGSTPSMAADNGLSNGRTLFKNNNSKGCCCCFPWGGN